MINSIFYSINSATSTGSISSRFTSTLFCVSFIALITLIKISVGSWFYSS